MQESSSDEYLKELDDLFNTALLAQQHQNLAKLQTSSTSSASSSSSQIPPILISPTSESSGGGGSSDRPLSSSKRCNSSSCSSSSSNNVSSSKAAQHQRAAATTTTTTATKFKLNHEFNESVKVTAVNHFVNQKKTKSLNVSQISNSSSTTAPVQASLKVDLNRTASLISRNKQSMNVDRLATPKSLNKTCDKLLNCENKVRKPIVKVPKNAQKATKLATPGTSVLKDKVNCMDQNHHHHYHNHSHDNLLKLPTTKKTKTSSSKISSSTTSPSSLASNASARCCSARSSDLCLKTLSSSTTTTSSHNRVATVARRHGRLKIPDDTDLDVSLSNYSKIHDENDNISVSCMSFKSDSPLLHSSSVIIDEQVEEEDYDESSFDEPSQLCLQHQVQRSIPYQKPLLPLHRRSAIKVCTKKSSLNNIIQKRKMGVISSLNSNNLMQQSLFSLLNTANQNNSSPSRADASGLNISSLMSDLFLVNLLHASNKNLTCVLNDFMRFAAVTSTTAATVNKNTSDVTPMRLKLSTSHKTSGKHKGKRSQTAAVVSSKSREHCETSPSSSVSSMNYFEPIKGKNSESSSLLICAKPVTATSATTTTTAATKIEKLVATTRIVGLSTSSSASSTANRPSCLEMPNIDDPMLFIDNLYNQILAGKTTTTTTTTTTRLNMAELVHGRAGNGCSSSSSNHSESVTVSSPTTLHHHYTAAASLFSNNNNNSTTFDVNSGDFSYIEMYSNATNETNSFVSENDTTVREAGGVLGVKDKSLIDWNYEDNNFTSTASAQQQHHQQREFIMDVDQTTDADCDEGALDEDEDAGTTAAFFNSQTTVISNNENNESECNCDKCEKKSEDEIDRTVDFGTEDIAAVVTGSENTQLVNGKTPSWLMLKLLNSCSDLNEKKSFQKHRPKSSSRSPAYKMNRFLSLNDFSSAVDDQDLNVSISSMRSSTSTTYLPMKAKYHVAKRSCLFKPVEINVNDTRNSCASSSAVTPLTVVSEAMSSPVASIPPNTTSAARSYIQLFYDSFVNSVKYVVVSRSFILVPVVLILLTMKTRRGLTISSASGVSLSHVMQTSSLTTAARASATAAATATFNSLFSYYNQ
jgi:hypothetical protein